MTTDQNTTQSNQDLAAEIADLIKEAEAIGTDIDATTKETKKIFDDAEANIDETTQDIEENLKDLDGLEVKANDELDALMIKQAEDLGEEDEEEVA